MSQSNLAVHNPAPSQIECAACRSEIPQSAAKEIIGRNYVPEYYHEQCYMTKVKRDFIEDCIKTSLEIGQTSLLTFGSKLNSNHRPIDEPYEYPPQSIRKVDSKPSKFRRAWMEVFKFIPPQGTLKSLSFVCKEFYHLIWDQELWQFYCVNEFGNFENILNWRNHYANLAMTACIGCNAIMESKNFYICPSIKRPICLHCRFLNPEYERISKKEIKEKFKINPNVLNLKFNVGGCHTFKMYKCIIKKEIDKHRNKNKESILKKFKKTKSYDEIKQIIDAIDLSKIDEGLKISDDLILNPFYDDFDGICKFVKNREGGLKYIKKLADKHLK